MSEKDEELQSLERARFHNMPYFALPEDALDDPEIAVGWVRKAAPWLKGTI